MRKFTLIIYEFSIAALYIVVIPAVYQYIDL